MDSSPKVGAVIALKSLTEAKTRLSAPSDLRQRIALTMFLDTAAAVSAVADQTVVVSTQPGLQELLHRMQIDANVLADEPPSGLNPALRHGEAWLRNAGGDRILACVGDLPSLTSSAVRMVLTAADRSVDRVDKQPRAERRYFVSDMAGLGTTMLITDQSPLQPRFGGPSGQAHLDSGAESLRPPASASHEELEDWSRARRDVDTEEDLREAHRLGLGGWTASLIDPRTGSPGTLQTVTVAERFGTSSASTAQQVQAANSAAEEFGFVVMTESGYRLPLTLAAIQGRADRLRAGQRLHAVIGSGQVLAAWW